MLLVDEKNLLSGIVMVTSTPASVVPLPDVDH